MGLIGDSDEDRLIVAQNEQTKAYHLAVMTWAWVGSLVSYLLLSFAIPIISDAGGPPAWVSNRFGPLLYELRLGLGSALVAFFAFTAFHDLLKKFGDESTERGLISAISGSARLIASLDKGAKEQHLGNTLNTLLGPEFGTALFQDMIGPILTSGGGFRSKYKYDVTVLEVSEHPNLQNFFGMASLRDPSKYHWVHEQIEYQAHGAEGSVSWGPFFIVMAFDKDTLHELYIDPRAYFRSLIELDPDCRSAFFSQTDEEIERFVRDAMRLKLTETVTKRQVAFSISVERTQMSAPTITVTATELTDRSSNNKLRVDFIYPHRRDATHFTYSMPQPCKDPSMTFRGSSEIRDLEVIDYFSKVPQERRRIEAMGTDDDNPTGYEIEIDGWVFPMSGVTFTWRSRHMTNRHIANLVFGASRWRVYLAWQGEGSGDDEVAQAMSEIETAVGPQASSAAEFLKAAQNVFRSRGFEIFKG